MRARGRRTRLSCIAVAAPALLTAACGSAATGPPARPAQSAPATSRAAARSVTASRAPAGLTPTAIATGAARRRAAARYLAIARPANRRRDHDFDDGLDGGNLAASEADLRAAAATERRFDRQLLALPLAPGTEAVVRILVAANQSRARLTGEAARATTLAGLHGFERRLAAANVQVEGAVRVIRSELGLPPPESS